MVWPMVAAVVAGSAISGAIGAKGAKDAAAEQRKGAEAGQKLLADAAERARQDVMPLFRQAQRDSQAGFQAGLGVIGEAVPAQIDAMQQGNVAAQETLIAGMDPFRSAILGQPNRGNATSLTNPFKSFFKCYPANPTSLTDKLKILINPHVHIKRNIFR